MTIAISATRAAALAAADQTQNPFVAWDNLAVGATLGGSPVHADGPRENAITGATFDAWRPTVADGTARFRIQLPAARSISFVGVAVHNLHTLGASATVQRSSDGVTFSSVAAGTITPTDNSPMAWRMQTTGQDYEWWQLSVTGMDVDAPLRCAVVFFGDDLVIPERLYQGFAPPLQATDVDADPNVSEGAHLLATAAISRGSRAEYDFTLTPPDFVRGAAFQSFQAAFNASKGFFTGWRPGKYPQDVFYGWRSGAPVKPVNGTVKDRMAWAMGFRVTHE